MKWKCLERFDGLGTSKFHYPQYDASFTEFVTVIIQIAALEFVVRASNTTHRGLLVPKHLV